MNAIEWTFQLRFALALALGFLVGLERESAKDYQKLVFGGVRTHPIISLLGFGCAWLYQMGVTFMLPAGLASLGALAVVSYLAKIREDHYGTTSEISALLTYVTGALALLTDVWVVMALGVVNATLLSEKARLESLVERLNKAEFLASLKFLLVTVIILPVLPDQEYTSFRINPATTWKFVIIVSTVGFVGYVLTRRLGTRVGLWMSGILGGIASSTALTVAMGRMARMRPTRALGGLQASLLAGAVMYIRIVAIIFLISPALGAALWWRAALLMVIGAVMALTVPGEDADDPQPEVPGLENPFEITPALLFAALFVLLTVLVGLVRGWAGATGLLTLAAVVGVVDIDPFILSMVPQASVTFSLVVSAILVAGMSNTLAKGVYYFALVPSARWQTAWRYALWGALHIPIIITA
jgi:uncharacterized membrane protein (DUF4010 family)